MKNKTPSLVLALVAALIGLSSCGKPAGALCDFHDHTEGFYQINVVTPTDYVATFTYELEANRGTSLDRRAVANSLNVTPKTVHPLAQTCGNSIDASVTLNAGPVPMVLQLQDKDGNVLQSQTINALNSPVVFTQ